MTAALIPIAIYQPSDLHQRTTRGPDTLQVKTLHSMCDSLKIFHNNETRTLDLF